MMKKITALFLILILALSLAACGEKLEDKVVGTWESEIDLSDAVSVGFAQMGLDESQLPSEKITGAVTITLNEDKTSLVAIAIDAESFEAYMQSFSGIFVDMMNQIAEEQGVDAAVLEEQLGMSVEEYVDTMMSELDTEKILADANTTMEGTWAVEEEKIVLTTTGEDDVLEYKDGKLLLDSDADLSEFGIELPLAFTKK